MRTPPKFNMEPKNEGLEDVFPFHKGDSPGSMLVFQGVPFSSLEGEPFPSFGNPSDPAWSSGMDLKCKPPCETKQKLLTSRCGTIF